MIKERKTNKKTTLILVSALTIVLLIAVVISTATSIVDNAAIQKSIRNSYLQSDTKANEMTVNQKIKSEPQQKLSQVNSDLLVKWWGLDTKNTFKNINSHKDANGKNHIRYQQVYDGIPVWGGNIIVHTDENEMITKITGKVVGDLQNKFIKKSPSIVLAQAVNVAKEKATDFVDAVNPSTLKYRNENTELVVYSDGAEVYEAYHMSYVVDTPNGIPARPHFVIDAKTGNILKQWNGLTTNLVGTGLGGNTKIGQHEFGTTAGYGYLDVTPGALNVTCTMTDQFNYLSSISLDGSTSGSTIYTYPCFRNTHRTINGGYSPLNDGHYYGRKTTDMYQSWVGVVPNNDGNPLTTDTLLIKTGYGVNIETAFWDGTAATFSDGANNFYPLSSGADVVAHEVSHSFTEKNSALIYDGQSGGINEAYSDIAGEAFEYYLKGSTDWLVGADVMKSASGALRYFQNPRLDGYSIAHASQFTAGLDVHESSGVFNRVFYLVANLPGWNVQTAFQVFASANQNYWIDSSDFADASCGVLNATVDAGLDPDPVRFAFQSAGVFCSDTSIILDTDGDAMSDTWEVDNSLSVGVNDANQDADSDTYTNLAEYKAQSNPQNAHSVPTQTVFNESFENLTLPNGWTTTFGSDSAWVPVKDASHVSNLLYSLAAKPLAGKYAQVEFSRYFINGTTLSFDYLINEGSDDSFDIYIDGVLDTSITGAANGAQWINKNIVMTQGNHTILFQFKRNSVSPSGSAVYIDNMHYTHLEADSDHDALGDSVDDDDDGDGVLDVVEVSNGTDPLNADTDADGYEDGLDAYPLDARRLGMSGTTTKANFGSAVATADMNNDGYDDVVIASPKDDPINQTTGLVMKDAGTVKVYSGMDGVLLYSWIGEAAGDNFGSSVANAGDVNNDGKVDIIIGAKGYDPIVLSKKLTNAGAAYVYSAIGGVTGTQLYKFEGEVAGDNFGVSVAGGNIDGDAKKDLIVGANLFDPLDVTNKKMSAAGRVYVFSGASGIMLYEFDGNTAGDTFGSAVAVGDVNNDGRDDIIIGSPKDEPNALIKDSGAVDIYSGANGTLLTRLSGAAVGDAFGTTVAVGNIDANGGNDIVVGAPKHDVVATSSLKDAGAVYVYSGVSYSSIASLNKTGGAIGDAFGSAVAVGDVNNDGRADVVVGVCKSDYTNAGKIFKDAGSVNVYSGLTGVNLITGSTLTGTLKNQWFGCAVATGDVNNDSFSDVVVGSPNDDPALIKDAGSVDVYSGINL